MYNICAESQYEPPKRAQDQREASLKGFREEEYDILVATNVAGRGIDVPDVRDVTPLTM